MAYVDETFTASSWHHVVSREHCCLVPMAALKLAIKLNEPRRLNMDDMLRMGETMMGWFFTFNDVVEMERAIIMYLSYNVSAPTAFVFACQMICLLPHEVWTSPTGYVMEDLARHITMLATCKSTVLSRLLVVITASSCFHLSPNPCLGLIIISFLLEQVTTRFGRCIMYHWWALQHVWLPWNGAYRRLWSSIVSQAVYYLIYISSHTHTHHCIIACVVNAVPAWMKIVLYLMKQRQSFSTVLFDSSACFLTMRKFYSSRELWRKWLTITIRIWEVRRTLYPVWNCSHLLSDFCAFISWSIL